jgi:hypothetical protein
MMGKVTTLEPQLGNCLGKVFSHGSTLAEDKGGVCGPGLAPEYVGHLTSISWSTFIRYSLFRGMVCLPIKVFWPRMTSP